MNTTTAIVRALFLYHLTEYQTGNATTIKVSIEKRKFRISDNGRGHAIDRIINGVPYLRLVYSQLEYPFGMETDTPIQLHTIGMSLVNSFCEELVVTIHKKEKVYTKYYKDGQLLKEETEENQNRVTGTTVEGKINTELIPGEIDLQEIEQWLTEIKSINKQLRLVFNDNEL
jgi:DNA gyrase/topoisomerase IV subunit B